MFVIHRAVLSPYAVQEIAAVELHLAWRESNRDESNFKISTLESQASAVIQMFHGVALPDGHMSNMSSYRHAFGRWQATLLMYTPTI